MAINTFRSRSSGATPVTPFRNLTHLLACGFGSGAAPVAPGTFGTVAAIPIYLLMLQLDANLYLLLTAALFLVGIPICTRTADDLGVHDHPGIVWDEIVGYLVTMIAAPPGWLWMVVGFVLFRIFDILKPWPIRTIDRKVAGGLGIMLDDLLAGLFSLLLLQLAAYYLI
ncbi:phosphatidylglycerophosphatase A [Solemya pervernicosa gill symbiont]|uniref:Phosphatidylglycerophosphatase A n=2 Tax=Gammaproteobacteria incertae sedis TaxID=118884 RepID=A0A1T2L174_9GAMM|nr:phosphatidylglycerophosphatase A [Candidatus Reidiella endopervernicosa]OOZ38822.1 phosphatidylglycerophosphatase A [Solemya pervernicosa gill symbiont]QKQ27431.1 phosphatidylglycerophosphatase A [Candidatus Reidiella endopervernicosa]